MAIDIPEPNSVDPTALGTLRPAAEVKRLLLNRIEEKIELDAERSSYPEFFAEFVRAHFDSYAKKTVLVLPPGTMIEADLLLDWDVDWVKQHQVCAIACDDDLVVKGSLINRSLEGGPLLFVAGDLKVENVLKGGAPLLVLGNLGSRGVVVGEYNDGVIRIGGDLEAHAYLLLDHDGYVRGEVRARQYSDEDGDWREVLAAELFENEDEYQPSAQRIWAFAKTGREIWI
jgi:hypothetical protein